MFFLNTMIDPKIIDELLHVCRELENFSDVNENSFRKILNVSCGLMCLGYGKQEGDYEDLNELRTNLCGKGKDLCILPPT